MTEPGFAHILPLEGLFISRRLCVAVDSRKLSILTVRFPVGTSIEKIRDTDPQDMYSVPREIFGNHYQALGIEVPDISHIFQGMAIPVGKEAEKPLPVFRPVISAVCAVEESGPLGPEYARLNAMLGHPLSLNAGDTIVAFAGGTATVGKNRDIFDQHIAFTP